MLNKLKAFVRDLASTNWLIVTGTCMGTLTGIVYCAGIILTIDIQLDVWLGWLAFLSSWMGFGVRQFRHKRETNFDLHRIKQGGENGQMGQDKPKSADNVRP